MMMLHTLPVPADNTPVITAGRKTTTATTPKDTVVVMRKT